MASPITRPEQLAELLGIPFTPEQLACITAPLAPGVIVAGAGSGKTTVMAARVLWLVGTGQVAPEQAERIGLATQVVDDDELPAAARALARRLADGPALAYSTTKVMLTRELDMSLGSAIEMEALTQALLMQTSDHREFHAAWSEGRKPAWSGR